MNPKEYLEFLYKLEGSYGPFKLSNDEDTIKAEGAWMCVVRIEV